MRMCLNIEFLSLADTATRETRVVKIKFPIFELKGIRTRVLRTEEGAENDIRCGNR